jgi:hypothetical protein
MHLFVLLLHVFQYVQMRPDSERKCASGRDKNVHIRYVVVKNYHLISKNKFIIP